MGFSDQIFWFITRSAGIISWFAAALSILAGLLLSSRFLGRKPTIPYLTDIHRFLGGLSVFYLLVHMVTLLLDEFIQFGLADLLIPGVATLPGYSRLSLALGVIAAWLLFIVEITSLLKGRMPKRVWHGIHLTSFLILIMGTWHGVDVGSENGNRAMLALGSSLVAAVLFVGSVRVYRLLKTPSVEPQAEPVRTAKPAVVNRDAAADVRTQPPQFDPSDAPHQPARYPAHARQPATPSADLDAASPAPAGPYGDGPRPPRYDQNGRPGQHVPPAYAGNGQPGQHVPPAYARNGQPGQHLPPAYAADQRPSPPPSSAPGPFSPNGHSSPPVSSPNTVAPRGVPGRDPAPGRPLGHGHQHYQPHHATISGYLDPASGHQAAPNAHGSPPAASSLGQYGDRPDHWRQTNPGPPRAGGTAPSHGTPSHEAAAPLGGDRAGRWRKPATGLVADSIHDHEFFQGDAPTWQDDTGRRR